MPNLDGNLKPNMEPNNTTPQTPATDAGNGNGQPTQPAAAPQNGNTQPQGAQTPTEPANPQQPAGTGTQAPIRNNPDGNQPQGDGAQPVNYEEKFAASTRENQRYMDLLRQNDIDPKTGQRVQPGQQQPGQQPETQPTGFNQPNNLQQYNDAQLAEAIPGFNALNAAEKDVIRYAKGTAKTIADLQRTVAELYDERTTNQQIEKMKANEQYKPIAENEKLFREYAYREENLSLDIEHVALKFMNELNAGTLQGATPDGQQPTQPVQPGMEGTSGGAKQVNAGGGEPGVREMTAAEAAELRRTDHRQYNDLAKKGKLKIVSR